VGTFGIGLFGNDTAADLLALLERSSVSERSRIVERFVEQGARACEEDSSELLPEEVITVSAVLAAALEPPLAQRPDDPWPVGVAGWVSKDLAVSLAGAAVHALDVHTGAGTWWRSSWDSDEDRDAMISAVDRVREVLAGTVTNG
jgi:hypothetical protein